MCQEELITIGVLKFLNGEGKLTDISRQLKLSSSKLLTERLESMGYKMYRGAKLESIIGLKLAVEEYISRIENCPSITKIATKYNIGKPQLSNRLKELGYEVINYLNVTKIDENVFDSIDTEEKAYWLGFIYADGCIGSTDYSLEISLKSSDSEHLEKFNSFIKGPSNKVKISNVRCGEKICERCRWSIHNSHIHEVLNSYGCVPNKSLILEFPDKSVFKDVSLIRHFIRGYWDGDGCLTYCDKEHLCPNASVLGTENFLSGMLVYLPFNHTYKLGFNNKNSSITRVLSITGKSAFNLITFLYKNATIYLQRKYEKYLEYCRLYEKSYRSQETKIGEDCDVNPEVITETKESVTP